jgi:two-component system, LuxR family, response regulator FixJ
MAETVFIVVPLLKERDRIVDALAGETVLVKTYESAECFFEEVAANDSGCVLVPLDLPGMGLRALVDEIRRRSLALAVVVLGRGGEFAAAVELVRSGAFDFLEHPYSNSRLRLVVRRAIGASG